jgi:hypothetical protein
MAATPQPRAHFADTLCEDEEKAYLLIAEHYAHFWSKFQVSRIPTPNQCQHRRNRNRQQKKLSLKTRIYCKINFV